MHLPERKKTFFKEGTGMIVMVRLDERLIHGQVAIKWSRHLSVDRIVVVSDEAAANPVVQKSLMMAAPATAKTTIKSLESAVKLLQDPKAAAHRILIIVSNPADLLKIVKDVKGIPLINVGNYGRVAAKRGTEVRKTYGSNLYAYDDEAQILKEVISAGMKCIYQTTPDDTPEELAKVLG